MRSKLLQTALVDVLNHTRRASRDFPTLLQTLCLALAVGLVFAVHEVIVVGFAAGTDEEGGGEQGRGGGADFWDLGDAVGEGSGVDEDLLVEAGELLAANAVKY